MGTERQDPMDSPTDDAAEPISDTEYLLSIPGMRESIIEGMQTPLDECRRSRAGEARLQPSLLTTPHSQSATFGLSLSGPPESRGYPRRL